MSKISLKPNSAGTANFEIAAPATNVDRTFTLPDEAGTVVTTATDLEPQVKDSLNATGIAPIYACRAWVNFDDTGTVAIRDSGNVSSITDLGNGAGIVNFSTNMPDTNYSVAGIANGQGSGSAQTAIDTQNSALLTNRFGYRTIRGDNAQATDSDTVCFQVFR